jgi:uncharacterized protein (TIGR03435 family)
MTRNTFSTRSLHAFIERCLGRSRAASRAQVELSETRALQRLRRDPMWESDSPLFAPAPSPDSVASAFRQKAVTRWMQVAALAVIISVIVAGALIVRDYTIRLGLSAVVEPGENSIYLVSDGRTRPLPANEQVMFGDIVRSNGGIGGMLRLADGSRVEMRSQSELTLERADDGVRIRLGKGGIIVNAAKQRDGHLYVLTKDVTVSVVGTVFLVNADREGSRVAVIEGEVRVQQGTTQKNLRPGEQATSSASMQPQPVAEELAWSRNAGALVDLLRQAPDPTPGAPPAVRATFETISIRARRFGDGAGRGGGGGSNMSPFAEGCAAAFPQIDPRRFAVTDTTVWNLITAAYSGNPHVYGCTDVTLMNVISGGPAWIKSEKWDIEAAIPEGALRPNELPREGHWQNRKPSKLQEMIEALLVDRFKLVVRRHRTDVPAYALRMADKGAPKFTPPPHQGTQLEEWKRRWDADMPSGQSIAEPGGNRGKDVYMEDLVPLLAGATGRPVIDQTGFIRPFSFYLSFRPIDNGNRFSGANNPRLAGLPTLFDALEQQMGLSLEETSTSVEVWVIDRIERATEN